MQKDLEKGPWAVLAWAWTRNSGAPQPCGNMHGSRLRYPVPSLVVTIWKAQMQEGPGAEAQALGLQLCMAGPREARSPLCVSKVHVCLQMTAVTAVGRLHIPCQVLETQGGNATGNPILGSTPSSVPLLETVAGTLLKPADE